MTGTLIGRLRKSAGLSQTELARRSGVPQASISLYENAHRHPTSDTLERLFSASDSQVVLIRCPHPTIATVATTIADDLASGRFDNAYRAFLVAVDGLRTESALNRILLSAEEPEATGDPRLDAALAGVVAHYLRGLPQPRWVDHESRFLAEPWFVDDSAYGRAHDPALTPRALRARNVILAEEGLNAT